MAATARRLLPPAIDRLDAPLNPKPTSEPLWLCAHFPELALEVLGLDLSLALASSTISRGQIRLHKVSIPARQTGIEPGMTPAAAKALCPALIIADRDPLAENLALQQLAEAALNFSPRVNLLQPESLLLEISTCLSLFGGAENLQEKLTAALTAKGHYPQIAITPSATASHLLARLNMQTLINDRQALRSALGPLPIAALELDDKILRRLLSIGVRQLADLWRLPRDGLARRYGVGLLCLLDKLAGRQNQVLPVFNKPPRFHASCDMPIELERLEHFFPAIEQLAEAFSKFLLTRDATALSISLTLKHHSLPASNLQLTFRSGSRDPKHWCKLLHEKLERSPLPAPVLAISLQSQNIVAFQPERISLFDDDYSLAHSAAEWDALLDQLQARLGQQALQWPHTQADHRPEHIIASPLTRDNAAAQLAPRPLWLLAAPKPLRIADIQLLSTAERIESGWWDEQPIRRDYYIAQDNLGRKLWVYHDLDATPQWYLHGLFG